MTSGPYSCSSLTMLTANGNFCFAGSSQGTLKSSVKDVSIHLTTKPSSLKEKTPGDSPGGPDSKIQRSQCRGPGSILGRGTRSHRPQLRPGMAKYIYIFLIEHIKRKDTCAEPSNKVTVTGTKISTGTRRSAAYSGKKAEPWERVTQQVLILSSVSCVGGF